MIHHYSIPAGDTKNVATVLAHLFGGSVSRFGPYDNSYIVWLGDEHGSAIELYPSGTEMLPDDGEGQARFVHNPHHSRFCGTHAAISIQRSSDEILRIATAQNWQARVLSRGGFDVIEFWIENQVMLELLTPAMTSAYLATTCRFVGTGDEAR